MRAQQPATHQPAPVVLVIDDEDYVALVIGAALELEGYQTFVAFNAREGLELAQTVAPDLVIIDMVMPSMNGEALTVQLRAQAQLRNVPVLLISAGVLPHRDMPNKAFLPKPFNIEALLTLAKDPIAATHQKKAR